jgi:hypothetical protein
MADRDVARARSRAWPTWSLAALGLALAGLGFFADRSRFLEGYLVAFVFWSGLALGSLFFALLHPLVGGAWGLALRAGLWSAARTLPLLAVLFLPIAFGLTDLYGWARPEAAADPRLAHKLGYLAATAFRWRALAYFVAWAALALAFLAASKRAPDARAPASGRLKALCAGGLILLILTVSLAAVDWVMSLERDYDSTVFGLAVLAGQALAALALAVVVSDRSGGAELAAATYGQDVAKVRRDLGSLLCTAILVWAYLQFSQLIINWSGDRATEIDWYLHRMALGWSWISVAVLIVHFALPFFVLLFRPVKESGRRLALVGAAILVAHVLATRWLVTPSFPGRAPAPHPSEIAAFIGLGAIWLAVWWARLAAVRAALASGARP